MQKPNSNVKYPKTNQETLQNYSGFFFHFDSETTRNTEVDELYLQGTRSRPSALSTHTIESYNRIFHSHPTLKTYTSLRILLKLQDSQQVHIYSNIKTPNSPTKTNQSKTQNGKIVKDCLFMVRLVAEKTLRLAKNKKFNSTK